jgi:hypothetical protein
MMLRSLLIASLCLSACGPNDILLRGRVSDDVGDKSMDFDGALIEIREGTGPVVGETVTNSNGRFSVRVPRAARIFAVISGDGFLPTSFTGASGIEPVLRVPEGTLFGVPESTAEQYLSLFEGCPAAREGGFSVGRVRVENLTVPETGENPIVSTARIEWNVRDRETLDACYLNDEGTAYDPTATLTGPSGWYLVPNVAVGTGEIIVSYSTLVGAEEIVVVYPVYMPEDGVIARFPTWVTFDTPS